MSVSQYRRVTLVLATATGLLIAGCGGGGGGVTPPPPSAKLVVTPSAVSVEAEQVVQFSATASGVATPKYTYSLQNPVGLLAAEVASKFGTIDSSGKFTAGAQAVAGLRGSVVVLETSRNLTANVPVVIVPFVRRVEVAPTEASVLAGESLAFTATPYDINGNPISPFLTDWRVTGGIGSITSEGIFTATKGGSGTVTAKIGGAQTVVVHITVVGSVTGLAISPAGNPILVEAGTQRRFQAVVRDAAGNETVVTAQWSLTAAVGTITSGGTLTAGKTVGATGTLTASYKNQQASLPIRVTPLVTPPTTPANVIASVKTAAGAEAAGATVTARLEGQTEVVASVVTGSSGTGRLWLPVGVYTLTATLGGKQGTARVNVANLDEVKPVNLTLAP